MIFINVVKFTIDKNFETIEIHTLSDWHIGDIFSQKSEIREQIKYIAEKPNAYVICNGDLINNATKNSVSSIYDEEIPPMEQISLLTELLEPIKDKIILITQGNHEARTYKDDGIDIMHIVAKQLGISDRYSRVGGLIFLRFGANDKRRHNTHQSKICYTIYSTHGSGGGRKEGAKAIRLADMAAIVDADIYIHSHTHLPMVMKEAYYRTSQANNSVKKVDKLFVNTSAKLDYGGYGQAYEFKPSSTANPVIYLSGSKKEFTAKL